jgi:hypothetical protein
VEDDEGDKGHERRKNPVGGKPTFDNQNSKNDCGGNEAEFDVSRANVTAFELRRDFLMSFKAARIFLARVGCLCGHELLLRFGE